MNTVTITKTILATVVLACAPAHGIDSTDVLVLFNSAWTRDGDNDGTQDSLQVARYYASRRNVRASNVVGLPIPATLNVTTLHQTVIGPVREAMQSRGTHVVAVCTGVPLKYGKKSVDDAIMAAEVLTPGSSFLPNPYEEKNPTFGVDRGPYDHSSDRYAPGKPLHLVTRLDHPTGVADTLNLIDQAIYSETYAPLAGGILYVDSRGIRGHVSLDTLRQKPAVMSGSYGGDEAADQNIAATGLYDRRGLGLRWNQDSAIIGTPGTVWQDASPATTAPNAKLYSGWYAYNQYRHGVWSWREGAVACDFDSSSLAWTPGPNNKLDPSWRHSVEQYLTFGTQALIHGATAAVGVVSEPRTTGHPRPNVLAWSLLQGHTFAEASAMSRQRTAFVSLAVGDPLFRPYPLTPSTQKDTTVPKLAAAPRVDWAEATGTGITFVLAQPEVAKLRVSYGINSLSESYECPCYWARHVWHADELDADATYQYRATFTDPAGQQMTHSASFKTPKQEPWGGRPSEIPGRLEAENYDTGGQQIAVNEQDSHGTHYGRPDSPVTVFRQGDVTWVDRVRAREWMEYTVDVKRTGQYRCTWRIKPKDGIYQLNVDGVSALSLATVTGPNEWQDVNTELALTSGRHVFRVAEATPMEPFAGLGYGYRSPIDYLDFQLISATPGPDPAPPTLESRVSELERRVSALENN